MLMMLPPLLVLVVMLSTLSFLILLLIICEHDGSNFFVFLCAMKLSISRHTARLLHRCHALPSISGLTICAFFVRGIQGGTALMEAATSGSQEVVDLLLAAGADPLVRDKDGVSPLMSAAAQVGVCLLRACFARLLVLGLTRDVSSFLSQSL